MTDTPLLDRIAEARQREVAVAVEARSQQRQARREVAELIVASLDDPTITYPVIAERLGVALNTVKMIVRDYRDGTLDQEGHHE